MDINRKATNNFWNGLSLPPLGPFNDIISKDLSESIITTTQEHQENIAVNLQVSENNSYNTIGDS